MPSWERAPSVEVARSRLLKIMNDDMWSAVLLPIRDVIIVTKSHELTCFSTDFLTRFRDKISLTPPFRTKDELLNIIDGEIAERLLLSNPK